MEKKTEPRKFFLFGSVILIMFFALMSTLEIPSKAISGIVTVSTTQTTEQTVTEKLPSVIGFNSSSPLVLSNFTEDLVIPLGQNFTISNSGFGSANYGTITIFGKLIVQNPLINYGVIVNSGTIIISNTFVNLNDSDNSFSTTGIVNNNGNITNSGFFYNGNTINNLGSITNFATFSNCVSGLNYTGQVTGNIITGIVNNQC